MSDFTGCKYCHGTEPLIDTDGITVCIEGGSIEGIYLVVEYDGKSTRKAIDYCPVCGERHRPFGPAWAHHRSP